MLSKIPMAWDIRTEFHANLPHMMRLVLNHGTVFGDLTKFQALERIHSKFGLAGIEFQA